MKSALNKIKSALMRAAKEYRDSQFEVYDRRGMYLINRELGCVPGWR